ncbi:hypothetical protein D1007_20527 [Hordeum vulgare]|nr:hypothetical protein D1007_20527 [Hordeum vulgare]
MQHQRSKADEEPSVRTDGGMRGGAKADGVAMGNIHFGALATCGMTRGVETTLSSATSGTSATSSGAHTASRNNSVDCRP